MVKTIKDAVIEFKGEWPLHANKHIVFSTKSGEIRVWRGTGIHEDLNKPTWKLLCTREEFNTLVDHLASNMGIATQTYAEYKKEYESMTTPLEAPIDDNSMQYKISNIGNVLHNISCSTDDEDEQNELGAHASFLWDLSQNYAAVYSGKTKNSKPVYTQAMCDNGELPSVGMECIAVYGKSEEKVTVVHINSNGQFACIDDGGDYLIQYPSEDIDETFKPLTPPIKLEDGKAYQFDYDCKAELKGIYNKREGKFVLSESSIYTTYCTNIKPLTVEGE